MAIWNGDSIEKSVKLFSNSDQWKNATLIQYSDGKIYAVAEDSSVTELDMILQNKRIFGRKVQKEIRAFVATPDYVAVGGYNKKVTVHDKRGDAILVNCIL